MSKINKTIIKNAQKQNYWDLSNSILYEMCQKYPKHGNYPEILAKILIIGRVYAAAIERRKTQKTIENENFYLDVVAYKIYNSDIDKWFKQLQAINTISDENISIILEAHLNVTNLFNDISDLDKRSLASKYLHFHFPNLFYIYDTRAVKSLSYISDFTGRVSKSKYQKYDNEYRKLYEKCLITNNKIKEKWSISMTPRETDNLLMNIYAST